MTGRTPVASAGGPQERAPKRKPFANDPEFHRSFEEHVDRPGAQSESLGDLSGADPGIQSRTSQQAGLHNTDKHHVFPQEKRAWFEKRGMVGANDIDNFTVVLDKSEHSAQHGGGDWRKARKVWADEYNTRVMSELQTREAAKRKELGNPKALLTPEEIKETVFGLVDKRSIAKDFVKY
jgi:hypothetical protein